MSNDSSCKSYLYPVTTNADGQLDNKKRPLFLPLQLDDSGSEEMLFIIRHGVYATTLTSVFQL